MKDLLSHRTGLATLDEGLMAGFSRTLSRKALCKYDAFRYIQMILIIIK